MDKNNFEPIVHIATCCNTEIWSKYSGHFCRCLCGNSYVDQTGHYIRVGGDAIEKNPPEMEAPVVIGEEKED
jgi:hypothetical protein